MKLYLVRHGESVSEGAETHKPLTERGKLDIKKVGRFLKNAGIEVNFIWHSAKLRAIQTAEILRAEMNLTTSCEKVEGMSPNDPIDKIAKRIRELSLSKKNSCLMIISHLPFLPRLAGFLLTGTITTDLIQFSPGGVVCLADIEDLWQVQWQVIPELIQ